MLHKRVRKRCGEANLADVTLPSPPETYVNIVLSLGFETTGNRSCPCQPKGLSGLKGCICTLLVCHASLAWGIFIRELIISSIEPVTTKKDYSVEAEWQDSSQIVVYPERMGYPEHVSYPERDPEHVSYQVRLID